MSSAIVTGAYSLVASALNYWITLAHGNGYTDDAYLTTPVGVDSLNFGVHAFKDLSVYNNPDGINGILAYTAVPAADVNDAGSLSTYLRGRRTLSVRCAFSIDPTTGLPAVATTFTPPF